MGNNCCSRPDAEERAESAPDPSLQRRILNQHQYGNATVTFVQNEPLEEEGDAIVNSAISPYVESESIIVQKAGPEIRNFLGRSSSPSIGYTSVTGAGNLKVSKIVHATLPPYDEKQIPDVSLQTLVDCYIRVFETAAQAQVKVLVFADDKIASHRHIPKLMHTHAIISAFSTFVDQQEERQGLAHVAIQEFKIVSKNLTSLTTFEFELRKRLDIKNNEELQNVLRQKEAQKKSIKTDGKSSQSAGMYNKPTIATTDENSQSSKTRQVD